MDAKEPVTKPPRPYGSLLNSGLLGRGRGFIESLAGLISMMPRTIADPSIRSTVPQHGMSDRQYRLRQSRRQMADTKDE